MIQYALMMMVQAAASPTFANNRVPDVALVSNLEKSIVMPKGAGQLASYNRSYTEAYINGKDTIIGQMIDHGMAEMIAKSQHKPAPPPVRRALMNEIMPAFDGGCGILTVFYEVGANGAPKVVCNPDGPH